MGGATFITGNEDLDNEMDQGHGSLMDKEFNDGMTVREAIMHINKCLEEK